MDSGDNAAEGQKGAVWRKDETVGPNPNMICEDKLSGLPGCQIPEEQWRLISRNQRSWERSPNRDSHPCAIGRAGDTSNFVALRQCSEQLLGLQIPKANRVVLARRESCICIRKKADGSDAVGMRAKREEFLALALLPKVSPLPAPEVSVCPRGMDTLK